MTFWYPFCGPFSLVSSSKFVVLVAFCFAARIMESKLGLELACPVLGLDAVLGGMAMPSMRSNELEHTAELPMRQWSS